MNLDQYMAATGITMESIEGDISKQAETSVREELALEALCREKGMEVTEEDIAETFEEMASESDSTPEELREKWESTGIMAVIEEQITHKKAIAWLMDPENVEVIEKAESADEADESAAEEEE
jgi:trigger factor